MTCAECGFWDSHAYGVPDGYGKCKKICSENSDTFDDDSARLIIQASMAFISESESACQGELYTRQDFGCVQFCQRGA